MSEIDTRALVDHLKRMPEVDRAAYLELRYAELDGVATELALPRRFPLVETSHTASDARPRREVWAPRLDDHPHVAPMPEPVREEVLHIVVAVESDLIERRMEHLHEETGDQLPFWYWNSTLATAFHHGDHHQPPPVPDIDTYLANAEVELERVFDDTIGLGIRAWIARQVEFLQMQGWNLGSKETAPGAGPSWSIDYQRRHLLLSPDLRQPIARKALTDAEAERFPFLTSRLMAATAPDPVAAAFPAAARTGASPADPTPEPAPEHQEGPAR